MPLELNASAEACGKVILLGEHSVVYGHPALAAGLAGGLTLSAAPLPDRRAPIELSIPGWGLDLRFEPGTEHPVARACLEVLARCDGPVTGWRIEGEARVPCRAGLGSSAALTVALARLALGEAPLDELIAASMAGERVFHGNPSGVDSEVAARGGVVMFARGRETEPVALAEPLGLVLVPSGIPRQTATLVAGVRARRERFPRTIDPILDALGALVHRGREAIERGELGTLAELTTIAHELLSALGVSLPALDRLCAAAVEAGAAAAKLTGAGGGGCVFALCDNPRVGAEVVSRLARAHPARASQPATAPFFVEVT